jgi:hypothetical protein
MTSTFLLPFAVGVCATAGKMEDAFGIVAMVAMTPLVVIQLLGIIYGHRLKVSGQQAEEQAAGIRIEDSGEITEYELVYENEEGTTHD